MKKKKKYLSFAVSNEELHVILKYLDTDRLAGLEFSPAFLRLNTDNDKLLFELAEKALLARGFLKPGEDGKLKLIDPIFAALGTCAFPHTSLLVTKGVFDDHQQIFYFHTYRKMLVIHTVPMTDIHQFMAVDEEKMVFDLLVSFLQLADVDDQRFDPVELELVSLLEARNIAVKQGTSPAFQYLVKNGLHKEIAQTFAESLAKPCLTTTVSYVAQSGEVTEGFTIIFDATHFWLISPSATGNESVEIKVTSRNEITEKVKKFVIH